MDRRRRAALRRVVDAFAPPDARHERIVALAETAIAELSPRRRVRLLLALDVLSPALRLPPRARRRALLAFAAAPVPLLRAAFAAPARLTTFLAYAESEPHDPNPTWRRIGYPGPRADRDGDDAPLALATARDGERIDADVAVIGSGAGGGSAAQLFARAGLRVVVLEAGGAFDARAFDQRELALAELYLERGLCATDDLGIVVLAGATLGGGTTVNWCTSLRLPDAIGGEWERASGIPGLAAELKTEHDALAAELGLVPAATHNANNAKLRDGCAALGWRWSAQPRNAPADCGPGCGYCGFGCAYAKKRSTARTALPEVVAAGGAIYARARAARVVVEHAVATGVEAVQEGRRFTVRAPLVVAAAGALRTPGLLARSGIASPALGRRLFLHPTAACVGEYADPVAAWEGPMQSISCDEHALRAGGYGALIETAPAHPGLAALATPWRGIEEHAREMDRARYAASFIAVTRDRDPGRVDLDDEAAIRYRVSRFDGANVAAGIVAMAEAAFAGGALRVRTLHAEPIVVERARWGARARDAFAAEVARRGFAPLRQALFSAHQMGTAALGTDPRVSVCDEDGAVRGVRNLLVADASLFPLASGVNPMLTIMALARRVAKRRLAATAAGRR